MSVFVRSWQTAGYKVPNGNRVITDNILGLSFYAIGTCKFKFED